MAQPKYEIIKRIGTGGMAEVFKASSTSIKGFQKLVAIKRVLPSLTENERFVRMFLDEAKIALPLNHTNIVQTFDLGMADETYFIVMEYVEGTTLKDIINDVRQEGGQIGLGEAAYIGLEICKGLAHAHTKDDAEGEPLNIVHRDISPPNILVSRDGEVKITDFGLAKAKSQAEATDPGVVKGKFGYLSPEAAQGEEIDERTDIFAVGILLWEMATGERLFLGESDYETLEIVREANVPPPSARGRRVPDAFQRILDGALAKDPDARFQSARGLAEQLASFLYARGEPVTSFDLAPYVQMVLGERTPVASESLGPADMAVQREINQFVSIDDLEDMDMKLARAEPIGEESGASPTPPEDGDFEDPRAWSDVGFEDEKVGLDDESIPEQVEQSGDEWKEQGLKDVARATQSMGAIETPDEPDEEREPPSQNPQREKPQQKKPPPQQRQQPKGRHPHPADRPQAGNRREPPPDGAPAPTAPRQQESEDDGSTTRLLLGLIGVLAVLLAAGVLYLVLMG